MRAPAVIALLVTLTGCGSSFDLGRGSGTVLVRCPPELPERPKCRPCDAWERPEIGSIEDQSAALDLAEAALVECRTVNSACVRRDTTVSLAWKGCPGIGE